MKKKNRRGKMPRKIKKVWTYNLWCLYNGAEIIWDKRTKWCVRAERKKSFDAYRYMRNVEMGLILGDGGKWYLPK